MEQDKLRKVHDGVENDMRYYAYLETASRRLNAPGASKLVDDSQFADMMEEIDSCISFMAFHVSRHPLLGQWTWILTIGRTNTESAILTSPDTKPFSQRHSTCWTLASRHISTKYRPILQGRSVLIRRNPHGTRLRMVALKSS